MARKPSNGTHQGRARAWTRVALALASVVAALASLEVLLRMRPDLLWLPRPPVYPGERVDRANRNFVVDEHVGWRMRPEHSFHWAIEGEPDVYLSDALGFRVDPSAAPSHGRPSRIVLTGDSFAFGTGVEYHETFGALLEQRLPGVSVRNLAMPGFGLDQIWMSIRHQALPLRPALVIAAFIDQDFDRSLTAFRAVEGFSKPTFQLDGGHLRRQLPADRPGRLWQTLEGLHLARLARRGLRSAGRRWPVGDFWHRNAAILTEMLRDCREAGVPLLFVRLPALPPREFPQLARFLQQQRASYLDLGRAPSDGRYHFPYDRHIDEAGHAWVADSIEAWLVERLGDAIYAGEQAWGEQARSQLLSFAR